MAKGISVFLGAALLLLAVVAVSALVGAWVNSLSNEESQRISTITNQQLGCQFADIYIKNVTYNCSGNCNPGVSHNITAVVVNNGKKTVDVSSIAIRNSTGSVFEMVLATETIAAGEQSVVGNISGATCVGINNSIESVFIGSDNCPGDAYDEYPGNDVTYLSC